MLIYHKLTDSKVITSLQQGAVGVLPSDTIYGLMCQAANKEAVARLYKLKSRERKPGTVIAASIEQIVALGIPKRYLTPLESYWPNPLTIIVASAPELAYLDQGKMSLAVRIPSDPTIHKLLEKTGPLLTSSANLPSEPPANTITEAAEYFGEEVDFYVDGGDLSGRPPSTIIRVIDDAVEVLREGPVKINEKGEVVA
jgi:L-threonylcarbamoyladenylate synthase